MKLKSVAVGHWLLGSTIQLKQVYEALGYSRFDDMPEADLKAALERISPKAVEYQTEAINAVTSIVGEQHDDFTMLEDGLLMLLRQTSSDDVEHDRANLSMHLDENVLPFLRRLSTSTSPADETKTQQHIHPIVIHATKATEEELFALCQSLGEVVYKTIKITGGQIVVTNRVAVIAAPRIGKDLLKHTLRYLMFARGYELELHTLFASQRDIWDELERMRKHNPKNQKELTKIRDRAQLLLSRSTFLRSRTKQMMQFLDWRAGLVDSYLSDKKIAALFHDFFASLKTTENYLREEWEMTRSVAEAAVQSLSLLYSENQANEIQVLQKLFLVATIISVFSLGTFAGSRMITTTAEGTVISIAEISTWHISSLSYYGGLVVIAAVLVYGTITALLRVGRNRKS